MVAFVTLYFKASYVNASRIVFANCEQTFLAAQAPKPVSFNHFWHMVIQEEVEFLVITKIAIIQGVFFYWSALRMTKYEEKFKYLNCSSRKVLSVNPQ